MEFILRLLQLFFFSTTNYHKLNLRTNSNTCVADRQVLWLNALLYKHWEYSSPCFTKAFTYEVINRYAQISGILF